MFMIITFKLHVAALIIKRVLEAEGIQQIYVIIDQAKLIEILMENALTFSPP